MAGPLSLTFLVVLITISITVSIKTLTKRILMKKRCSNFFEKPFLKMKFENAFFILLFFLFVKFSKPSSEYKVSN